MPALNLPTIKWGKRKERSQMYEMFTVDGRWPDREMPVLNELADDGVRSFLLDGANQYYCEEDNSWHQFASEIDFQPLKLRTMEETQTERKSTDDSKIENEIFGRTLEQKKAEQYKRANQNKGANLIFWIFSITFIPLSIIGLIVYLRGN